MKDLVELPVQVGPLAFSYATVFVTFVVMAAIVLLVWRWTRNLQEVPGRGQALLEMFVEFFDEILNQTMGADRGRRYLPYVGSLFLFIWG